MRGPVASSPAAVARYILRREPWPRRRFTRLPEHVDGNAAARIPIAANSEPERSHFREQPLANANSAILMKARVVTECTKKQLQRFRSEEHTSELQSLMRYSYAVFCLKKKKNNPPNKTEQKHKKNK